MFPTKKYYCDTPAAFFFWRFCQQDVDMAPRLGGSRGSDGWGNKTGSLEPETAIFVTLMGYTPEN